MHYVLSISHQIQSLTEWFGVIAKQPYAMLLDSAAAEHPNSRFDILVMQPAIQLQAWGCDCQVQLCPTQLPNQAATQWQVQQNPFDLVSQLTEQLLPPWHGQAGDLPFVGGWLGYVAYDAGRVLETLPAIAKQDIGLPDVALGAYLQALLLDKLTGTLTFVDATGQAEQQFTDWAQVLQLVNTDGTWQQQPQQPEVVPHVTPWRANMSKAQYLQKFDAIQAYLQSGDCYQINLAQRFSASISGSAWSAYLHVRSANQAPFSAFIQLPQGAVLSISPERFIEVRERRIETKPIKGTRPRFDDPILDAESAKTLAESPKDRAENVMIVDLLRNDLGKVSKPGSVKVPALFAIESFPAVHHLVSTVSGELATGLHALDALAAAFPGGSITGAPKIRAMQIIEELEPHRRSVYCGAIGYVSLHGHMDTNIAIRTLVIDESSTPAHIHCWAGGGIVADSEGELEYQETFDKVSKILPLLAALERTC